MLTQSNSTLMMLNTSCTLLLCRYPAPGCAYTTCINVLAPAQSWQFLGYKGILVLLQPVPLELLQLLLIVGLF
jgi:hypothetical protein